ncbi:MAG TPA: peroxiredoxin family protein [bacterium]|nr:peroxiredoxin family protein [bacterium]
MGLKRWMMAVLLTGALAVGCGPKDSVSKVVDVVGLGQKAPDFSLQSSDGRFLKSSDLQPGWYLVLIFYRGYWCSACQNQLLNLKDDFPKFAPLKATLAAVSVDSVEDSASFNQQWRFPFPLLSDPELKLIDAFGARHPQGHEGKDISHPAVVILDPNKIVRFKYIGQTPQDRPTDDEILYSLQQIEKLDAAQGLPAGKG